MHIRSVIEDEPPSLRIAILREIIGSQKCDQMKLEEAAVIALPDAIMV